ncbi:MAG TPA: hypothetical protein PLV92_30735 [Pirellulaceae bacterium]|nr:hypothetical protein [Pirellulaceae bacterium]
MMSRDSSIGIAAFTTAGATGVTRARADKVASAFRPLNGVSPVAMA